MILKHTKKVLPAFALMGVLACSTMSASANTVPVYLNAAATPIDVTISETVTITLGSNTNTATVSDLTITNNSTVGVIEVTNLNVNAKEGFTQVAMDHGFANEAMNAKKFALELSEHSFDLLADYTGKYDINPTANKVVTFNGKSTAFVEAVTSEDVAEIVVTLQYK